MGSGHPGARYQRLLIPGRKVKNGDDRLVILNQVARSVIESVRSEHPEFVFVRRGKPIQTMNNTAWQSARRISAGTGA